VIPGAWDDLALDKPMDIFGPQWHDHTTKIYRRWVDTVTPEDVVLVPGDISWAMTLEDASYDLEFLGLLPGKIIMIQGNHDYWWHSISRVRKALPPNVHAIQNDGILMGDTYFAGTRGWVCPGSAGFTQHDQKIYLRELKRLELSLQTVDRRAKKIIVMMHFMPVNDLHDRNDFINLLEKYGVEHCVYGHLHQGAFQQKLPDEKWGIRFSLVSADFLDFQPKLVGEAKKVGEVWYHE